MPTPDEEDDGWRIPRFVNSVRARNKPRIGRKNENEAPRTRNAGSAELDQEAFSRGRWDTLAGDNGAFPAASTTWIRIVGSFEELQRSPKDVETTRIPA